MKKITFVIAIIIFMGILGYLLGDSTVGDKFANIVKKERHSEQSEALVDTVGTLEEDLYNVDLIIKGTVNSIGESFKRDSGLTSKMGNIVYDVTPAVIDIKSVLYGEKPASTQITLLQHGASQNEARNRENFVKSNEDVILILVKTDDGYYWSYNFEDGIWKIKDGKVESKSEKAILKQLNKLSEKDLEKRLIEGMKNKKKRSDTIYGNK